MTLPVFPSLPGLTFTMVKTPGFKTLVAGSANEYENRLPQYSNPVWEWQLIFDFLHDYYWGGFTTVSELRTLMGFFNSAAGQAASFLLTDLSDYSVGPALVDSDPNTPLAQLPALVTDGTSWYSPIQRTLDGTFYEDITDLNGSIAVYADGELASTGSSSGEYEVLGPGLAVPGAAYMGLYLKWGGGTEPTGPITAAFNFYFRVRFSMDKQDFEQWNAVVSAFMGGPPAGQGQGVWTIGGSESQNGTGQLKLRTARPTPL